MRFFFTLTLLVFCLSPLSHAAALTDDIQQRYAQTTSFSANFEQTLTHKESGAIEKRRGVLLFQKPLLIRWTTEKPHTEILVATRQEIWDYLPDEEIVYKYPLDMLKDSGGIIQVLTGQAALTKDFEVVKSDGTENGLAKLRLYPKKPTPQLVEAVIWVESGYIRRTAITDFYGNTNDVRFTTFTPNAKTKASDFTFTPPKDVEMEDRTSAKTQEKELFR